MADGDLIHASADDPDAREVQPMLDGEVPADVAEEKPAKLAYLKPLAAYEAVYDLKRNKGRTIKRWVAIGRKKTPEDLPPLDKPEEMAAWWARCMTWTVPARLLLLADSKPKIQDAPAPVPAPAQAALPPAPAVRAPLDLPEGSGFAAALERAKEAERNAFARWQAEQNAKEPDAGKIEITCRAWERATEMVRKLEKDAEGILSRDLVAWPEVEKRVLDDLTVVNRTLRTIMTRVATKIGMPQEMFREADSVYQRELDVAFHQLAETDYQERPPRREGEPLTLQAA